jgi:hypothetical protein
MRKTGFSKYSHSFLGNYLSSIIQASFMGEAFQVFKNDYILSCKVIKLVIG